MNKILIFFVLSVSTISSFASTFNVFKISIINPSKITSDWDGDGLANDIDPDDDNDGIIDSEDTEPFSVPTKSEIITPEITGFIANPVSYFLNDNVLLSWNINNETETKLYDDDLLTNQIADVTGLTEFTVTPIGDKNYYLDAVGDTKSVSVFQYKEDSISCTNWSPDESNYNIGVNFTQSRVCTVYYSSNEPSTKSINNTEYRTATGTMYVYNGGKCSNNTITNDDVNELNRWSGFSYTMSQWCNMTQLSITDNSNITEIPDVIVSLSNLDDLLLYRNEISYVTTRLSELTKLWRVIISGNNITTIPESLWTMPDIAIIDVGNNNISSLPITKINSKTLDYLYVRGNPASPFQSSICNNVVRCYN